MPYIRYVEKNFQEPTLVTIAQARRIIAEYQAQGFTLTLRQLYYQFVARDLIPNEQKEYDRLGRVISDARLAGLIDWGAIEDRTRNLQSLAHWDDPADMVDSIADQFRVDRWTGQDVRVEVWIEKEALAGVFTGVCRRLDVPHFSCRGYTSQSEMWSAAQRMRRHVVDGEAERVVVLHFGDHDPSGLDMTRDIEDRLGMFLTQKEGTHCRQLEVRRVALNMDQVEEWDPPPNPAKVTDSRFQEYLRHWGGQSWELDALEPSVLTGLVEEHVMDLVDPGPWAEREEEIEEGRRLLRECSDRWPDVVEFLGG